MPLKFPWSHRTAYEHDVARPILFKYRSHPSFAIAVVSVGMFVDMCIYGIIVPVLPFALPNQFGIPQGQVASRTSYLVAAYAAGLLLASPVYAALGGLLQSNRLPMIIGLFFMIASTVWLMLATSYWQLVIARVWQGLAGSAIWTAGLVLLVESVPPERVGMAMGTFVLTAWTAGGTAGPPIGGALYDKVGYKGPFILCIALVALDLLGRVFVVERKLYDLPEKTSVSGQSSPSATESPSQSSRTSEETFGQSQPPAQLEKPSTTVRSMSAASESEKTTAQTGTVSAVRPFILVLKRPRALAALWLTFIRCYVMSVMDTVIPLYLRDHYGISSGTVGIVLLAQIIPVFFTSSLGGYMSDKIGAKYVCTITMAATAPVLIGLGVPMPLYGFVIVLAVQGAIATIPSPCTLQDLALVVKQTPGMKLMQVYSLWYSAFAASFLVAPLVSATVYYKTSWFWVSVLNGALFLSTIPICLLWIGEEGTLQRDWKRLRARGQNRGSVDVEAPATGGVAKGLTA